MDDTGKQKAILSLILHRISEASVPGVKGTTIATQTNAQEVYHTRDDGSAKVGMAGMLSFQNIG